jgi:2,3-diketo-5-methylthio-1-phosphopentane phosphatase
MDFDGTITRKDVIDALLENFADERWLEIEKQWRAGRIGSRDCLRGQIALVRAMPEEVDELVDSIEVDEGFVLMLEICARHNIPTYILSDGFDYCIRRILERPQLQLAGLLDNLRICSSHLETDGKRHWRATFPYFQQTCSHGCATCKPALMRLLNREGEPAIFVGDGLSDKYAAAAAQLLFAKNSLAAYCRQQAIGFVPFEELDEVAARLVDALPFDSSVFLDRREALSA